MPRRPEIQSERKEKQEKPKGKFKAIFNAHFISLVSKEYFSYNVL